VERQGQHPLPAPSLQHMEHSQHVAEQEHKHGDMANAAGFGGQRGEHTWATRMKKLQELKCIDIKPGKSGAMSNAIIWNPHYILRWHNSIKTPGLTAQSYNALMETALELGANDMILPWTPFPPDGTPPVVPAPPSTAAAPVVENAEPGTSPGGSDVAPEASTKGEV